MFSFHLYISISFSELQSNPTSILTIQNKTVYFSQPASKEPVKPFSVHYVYNSAQTTTATKSTDTESIATQQTVYNDLGVSLLQNMWEGRNGGLLCYGQVRTRWTVLFKESVCLLPINISMKSAYLRVLLLFVCARLVVVKRTQCSVLLHYHHLHHQINMHNNINLVV